MRESVRHKPGDDDQKPVRDHLLWLLRGGDAHVAFERAVAGLPEKLRGVRPRGLPYSPWQLVEHLRIAQWDILQFSLDSAHVSPRWPDEYWPKDPSPPRRNAWKRSVEQFRADLAAMERLVADRTVNLFAPIPHGEGQTMFREALLVADHNAYHLGQLIVLRRLLGAWKT